MSLASDAISRASAKCLGVQLYQCNCLGFDMADIHFHVWHYQRDPDGVVQGYTLGGAVEVDTEYFIDRTPSIRPSRKMELRMENLADYVQENPDLVVRRPGDVP